MQAFICIPGKEMIKTSAVKRNGNWFIGGDYASATFALGATILIVSKGKIYKLQGAFLKFQDMASGIFAE